MICSCGGRYPDGDEFCPFCNSRNAEYVAPVSVFDPSDSGWDFDGRKFVLCKSCGRTIDGSTSNCPICGVSLSKNQSSQSKNPIRQEEQVIQERFARSCANIAFVCGILSLIVAGPIFGSIAIFQGQKAKRFGFIGTKATAAIILGTISIVFWILFIFVVSFYVPRFAPHLLPQLYEMFGI